MSSIYCSYLIILYPFILWVHISWMLNVPVFLTCWSFADFIMILEGHFLLTYQAVHQDDIAFHINFSAWCTAWQVSKKCIPSHNYEPCKHYSGVNQLDRGLNGYIDLLVELNLHMYKSIWWRLCWCFCTVVWLCPVQIFNVATAFYVLGREWPFLCTSP